VAASVELGRRHGIRVPVYGLFFAALKAHLNGVYRPGAIFVHDTNPRP
jgi:hypothetical protein